MRSFFFHSFYFQTSIILVQLFQSRRKINLLLLIFYFYSNLPLKIHPIQNLLLHLNLHLHSMIAVRHQFNPNLPHLPLINDSPNLHQQFLDLLHRWILMTLHQFLSPILAHLLLHYYHYLPSTILVVYIFSFWSFLVLFCDYQQPCLR